MHIVHCYPAVSRFDLERAREEADEKKGRAERARQEYGVQVIMVAYQSLEYQTDAEVQVLTKVSAPARTELTHGHWLLRPWL